MIKIIEEFDEEVFVPGNRYRRQVNQQHKAERLYRREKTYLGKKTTLRDFRGTDNRWREE